MAVISYLHISIAVYTFNFGCILAMYAVCSNLRARLIMKRVRLENPDFC